MLKVQKYGGATLATPTLIKSVARNIAHQKKSGTNLVIVVSAMGKSTNELIELAHKVSPQPNQRELDMLLTTGERVSMALLSMALQDIGVSSLSLTGSQAGVITDESHADAKITDVKAFRVDQALQQDKVVVIAGFQGVSEKNKEITTLGRGGSDTTAVALATYLKCPCEIIKEVSGVFSADPQQVARPHRISHLNYDQLIDMSFWGAKVLHYRSALLAKQNQVPLFIGTEDYSGTHISKESIMYEKNKILATNTIPIVLGLSLNSQKLMDLLKQNDVPSPQILSENDRTWITGSSEILNSIKKLNIPFLSTSAITVTCSGVVDFEVYRQMCLSLEKSNCQVLHKLIHTTSVTFFTDLSALPFLHELAQSEVHRVL